MRSRGGAAGTEAAAKGAPGKVSCQVSAVKSQGGQFTSPPGNGAQCLAKQQCSCSEVTFR